MPVRTPAGPFAGGVVVAVDQEQAIVAMDVTTGHQCRVRPPVPEANGASPGIWAVSGPDEMGRVAFVEEEFPNPWHSLKSVHLDGTGATTVFRRPGDAIWKQAIGRHIALSRSGGKVAIIGQMHSIQMPQALLEEGPVEVWDLDRRTSITCGQALDQGVAWLGDDRHLVCVRLLARATASTSNESGDAFGSLTRTWDRVPTLCLVDVGTGDQQVLAEGTNPVISGDGGTMLFCDLPSGSGRQWRSMSLDTKAITSVPDSTDREYVAVDAGGACLYLQPPGPGEPVAHTKNNSPLAGPHVLLLLKRGSIGSSTGRIIAGGFDPRNSVSFGVVSRTAGSQHH